MKTLGEVHHGRLLEVKSIVSDCARAGRLASLGFLPGRRIRIAHVAPLGDPISVEMDGQQISVRRTEAALIEIAEVA
jgi:ferrous iron transport protein A